MNDDLRRKRITLAVKVSIAAAVIILITPLIFILLKGIIAAIVAGVLGMAAFAFAPVLAMKFANWKLGAMKAEARLNPIETRQQQSMKTGERLNEHKAAIAAFGAEVKSFEDEVNQLKVDQPEDSAVFEEQLRQLKALHAHRTNAYKLAVAEALKFDAATDRAARKWKVAQAAIRIQKLAGKEQGALLDKILAEESLDSVQTAMNRAFADLDVTMATEVPTLPAPTAPVTIDVTDVSNKERLGVRT